MKPLTVRRVLAVCALTAALCLLAVSVEPSWGTGAGVLALMGGWAALLTETTTEETEGGD